MQLYIYTRLPMIISPVLPPLSPSSTPTQPQNHDVDERGIDAPRIMYTAIDMTMTLGTSEWLTYIPHRTKLVPNILSVNHSTMLRCRLR